MEEKESIRLMLESLPTKIKNKEELILSKSRDADKLEVEMKSLEASFTFTITDELEEVYDDKKDKMIKKKRFKNDLERNRELELRLINNKVYNDNKERLVDLRKEVKEEEITLAYLKRRHRSALGLARILGD